MISFTLHYKLILTPAANRVGRAVACTAIIPVVRRSLAFVRARHEMVEAQASEEDLVLGYNRRKFVL